ncbi:hypothetical protein [Microlunatus sp. Gsoil 973]|uniref:hypothetical protein n=1 Tax=Microlunatus sp. Gsoil 973 TaxID=2672569 RepID=UPI0012B4BC81|nr:hypothetical protein [Microlunatus sp. Gsoil 973]QGN32739.1 hypothetical protein GJV80_07890 [Microlunatus sp. Gsoil 973]
MPTTAWERELPFAVRPESAATLIDQGITRGIYRGREWRRVRRGYYVPARAGWLPDEQRFTAAQRILDVTPALSGQAALATWAAAYIFGVDWLDGFDPNTLEGLPIDIVAGDRRRRQRKGITYRFTALPHDETVIRHGMRITAPIRTAFDGARWAGSLEDGVVFVDAIARFCRLDLDELKSYVAEHAQWIGIEQATAAVALAMPAVKSTWESRLRMCWLIDAALPPPLINVPIFDPREHLLGIVDLFDPESGLVAEFDGGQHRDPEQHRLDNIREESLESANLVVVRCDKTDIRRARRQLVDRLNVGHRRGQARDRSNDTWTLRQPAWWRRRSARWPPDGVPLT